MDRHLGMEFSLALVECLTKAFGKMTDTTVKDSKLCQTVKLTRENSLMDYGMEMESINGLTDLLTKAVLKWAKCRGKAFINGAMGDSIKANGPAIRCTAKENSSGQMEDFTREIIKTISNMDMVNFNGLMVELTKGCGNKANSMEKESSFEKMEKISEAFGAMAIELNIV